MKKNQTEVHSNDDEKQYALSKFESNLTRTVEV